VSYRIEITAASLEELADKALALGGRLSAVRTSVQVLAQAPAVETLRPALDVTEPETVAVEAAPEPVAEEAPAADVPDFDTEVTPLVLKLVEVKGKPAAQEVLGRFGVIKASQLSSDRWAELVSAINDELAA
jgi:hypothetical protein